MAWSGAFGPLRENEASLGRVVTRPHPEHEAWLARLQHRDWMERIGGETRSLIEEQMSKRGTLAGEMQRQVLRILLLHQSNGEIPTSGRFVFYELETEQVVRKSSKGESRRGNMGDPREQEATDALTYLRDRKVVPWDWIVDETRHLYEWEYAESVADYARNAVAQARINPWPDQPSLLIVESRSLGGVLRPLTSEYLCPIARDQRPGRGVPPYRPRAAPHQQHSLCPLPRGLGPPGPPDREQHPPCSGT